MDKRDYMENACCFDSSLWTKKPDASPTAQKLSVPDIISGLDALYEQGRENEAQLYLEDWRQRAVHCGDWRAELSIVSELLGQYRRSGDAAKGIAAVEAALKLIDEHGMADTVSGATVMLNAATTLKCFSQAKRSLGLFEHVSRVYSTKLDPMDYRFGGLYNNMALSLADMGDYDRAELYFKRAMTVIESCPKPENELAVTLCNMAEMYGRRDMEDERIEQCLDKAWALLNSPKVARDGYHAFTISKCASCFDYFGFFLYAMELKKRAENIYESN